MGTDKEEANERKRTDHHHEYEIEDEVYYSSSRGPMKVSDMHEEHAKNVLRIMLRKFKMLGDIQEVINKLEYEVRLHGHTTSTVVITLVSYKENEDDQNE